jgi:hypothetical protein
MISVPHGVFVVVGLSFQKLHAFYDRLCPECAELNFLKRNQTADLRGYVAVVTGGRVKIGAWSLLTPRLHCACCLPQRPRSRRVMITRLPLCLEIAAVRCGGHYDDAVPQRVRVSLHARKRL